MTDLSGGLATDLLNIDYSTIAIIIIVAIILVAILGLILSHITLIYKSKVIAKEVVKELKKENLVVVNKAEENNQPPTIT